MMNDPRKRNRGGAMLELAISMPLLMVLLLGIADLGRLYFFSVTGIGGSYTGATYGAMSTSNAADQTAIKAVATRDAVDAPNLDVTSTRYCQCGSGPSTIDCSSSCTSGVKRMYVKVTAQQTFKTLSSFWLIPVSSNLGTTTVFRVR